MSETALPEKVWRPPPEGKRSPKKLTDAVDTPKVAKRTPKGKRKQNGRIAADKPLVWKLKWTTRRQSLRFQSTGTKREAATKHDFLRLVSPVHRYSLEPCETSWRDANRAKRIGNYRTRTSKPNGEHVVQVPLAVWASAGGHRIDQALGRTADKSQRAFLIRCGNRIALLRELRARDRARLDAIERVNSTGQAPRGPYRLKSKNDRKVQQRQPHDWMPVAWTFHDPDEPLARGEPTAATPKPLPSSDDNEFDVPFDDNDNEATPKWAGVSEPPKWYRKAEARLGKTLRKLQHKHDHPVKNGGWRRGKCKRWSTNGWTAKKIDWLLGVVVGLDAHVREQAHPPNPKWQAARKLRVKKRNLEMLRRVGKMRREKEGSGNDDLDHVLTILTTKQTAPIWKPVFWE
jgi:hypothetical protein